VHEDIRWLASMADLSDWKFCFDYLEKKVLSKRWSDSVVLRVQRRYCQ
jgi:hypothetical protein